MKHSSFSEIQNMHLRGEVSEKEYRAVCEVLERDYGLANSNKYSTLPTDYVNETKVAHFEPAPLIGCLLAFIGLFAPASSFPIVGSLSLIGQATGQGLLIVIVFATLASLLGYRRTCMAAAGIFCISCIGLLIHFFVVKNIADQELARSLEGNPFAGFTMIASTQVMPSYAWILLILGSGTTFFSTLKR